MVASYSQRTGMREFYVDDIATATRQPADGILMAMTFLAQK